VRIGTAEIYRSLALLPEVEDSLIVNLDIAVAVLHALFVKLRGGLQLDAALIERIRGKLRSEYSRACSDIIYQIADIAYTLTGKRMEVPVALLRACRSKAANRDAVAESAALVF